MSVRPVLRNADNIRIEPLDAESRFARLTLTALGAVHLTLVLSLVFVLLTVGHALAQERAPDRECRGTNLLRQMEATAPARLAALEAEAGKVPNGEGLLWRVERKETEPSWLFGTMHVADPRVVSLPVTVRNAFDRADTVVVETEELLDPEQSQFALLSEPELTMFTDGRTLESVMSEDDFALVSEKLEERGLSVGAVMRMKPWMIAGFLALPSCERQRKDAGAPFLDMKLAREAVATGKELEGLETVREQLSAMAALPMEFHVRGLIETVSLGPILDDVLTTMTDLYVEGRTGMILPMIREAAPEDRGGETAAGYAAFEERIILARNRVMAERALPLIEDGSAFIAIGALHLPGKEGLIELLREAGYAVTRAD